MTTIIGQDTQIAAFLSELGGTRLHHAWLFHGPEGVGKASLAYAFAKRALCVAAGPPIGASGLYVPDDHPVGKLVDASSHPDLVLLERLPKDPKAVRDLDRRDWPENLERARSISVDQVRSLSGVFALKPSFSARRIVIVDAIDDMERGGANALLKSLEEPPSGTIFLLISHAPGRLLPTIRSRCRTLKFDPLDENAMRQVMRAKLPGADEAEIAALIAAGAGSPGRALGFAGLDIAGIDAALARIVSEGDAHNNIRSELAQKLSIKSAQARYEAFLSRAPMFIAGEARRRSGQPLAAAISAWEAARGLSDSAIRQSLDPQMTVFTLAGIVAGLAPASTSVKA
jgi:DNA polymerase III subunit delta'